jgi:hypothetical protein
MAALSSDYARIFAWDLAELVQEHVRMTPHLRHQELLNPLRHFTSYVGDDHNPYNLFDFTLSCHPLARLQRPASKGAPAPRRKCSGPRVPSDTPEHAGKRQRAPRARGTL